MKNSTKMQYKRKNESLEEYSCSGYIPGLVYVGENGEEYVRGAFYDRDNTTEKSDVFQNDTCDVEEKGDNALAVSEANDDQKVSENLRKSVEGEILDKLPPNFGECIAFLENIIKNGSQIISKNAEMRNGIETASIDDDTSKGSEIELRLKKRIVEITDGVDGEIVKRFYQIEVTVMDYNGKICLFEATVPDDQVRQFTWVTRATSSMAKPPEDKEEKKIFQRKVSACISSRGVPEEIRYPTVGWREIAQNGLRFITAEGAVGDPTICALSPGDKNSFLINREALGSREVFELAYRGCVICKTGVTSSLLWIYLHTALLTSVFEKAGFPVHFIVGLVGVTNSKKTSLALALTSLFGKGIPVADAEFATATACGIEKTLSVRKDGIILIDDFKPGVDSQQQKMMDTKLDQLIRYYGNRVAKSRMTEFNTNSEKLHFPIQGCCLITMEILTGVMSSLTRMFLMELPFDEVINERLSFFQKNPWILKTHAYDFLTWITFHMDEIITLISFEMESLRNKSAHRFAYPRFGEAFATFCVTAKIITKYVISKGFWNTTEGKNFEEYIAHIVDLELIKMHEKVKCADKSQIVIRALTEALNTERLKPLELNKEAMKKEESTFEDTEYFYIRASELRRISNEYARYYRIGQEILNEQELINLLERLGMILVKHGANKPDKSHHLPKSNGVNSKRYLYIKKERLAELQIE